MDVWYICLNMKKYRKEFSDLPYELRLSILAIARRSAFKEKIRSFNTIFSQAQNQWISRELKSSWMFKHKESCCLCFFVHMRPPNLIDLTYKNATKEGYSPSPSLQRLLGSMVIPFVLFSLLKVAV